jgi:histone arginine demethylase JMJD6
VSIAIDHHPSPCRVHDVKNETRAGSRNATWFDDRGSNVIARIGDREIQSIANDRIEPRASSIDAFDAIDGTRFDVIAPIDRSIDRRGAARARIVGTSRRRMVRAMDVDVVDRASREGDEIAKRASLDVETGRDAKMGDAGASSRSNSSAATETMRNVDRECGTTAERRGKYRSSETHEEHVNKKIHAAKRRTRSELSVRQGGWAKHGYAYEDADATSRSLKHLHAIERISVKTTTKEEFIERFERTRTPCVITDAMEDWGCYKNDGGRFWSVDTLAERFREVKFKVGTDDDGYPVRLKMKHIQHYVNDPVHMRDDSPMYAFDGSVFDKPETKSLLEDFKIPDWFEEDLFKHVGAKRRPPYRWIVFGPPRSGSSVHVDPLATSAWNALISGRKRWALYPPRSVDKATIKPRGIGLDGESVTWFNKMYPRTTTEEWKRQGLPPPIDVIQHPGEIMFVPDGWWHAVLNLDHTMAVTQNFSTSARFDAVWRITRRARPKMSARWLEKLRRVRPDLAEVADAQPRRSEVSAGEQTSSTSSSSSGSSDTEAEAEDEVMTKERETFERAAGGGGDASTKRTRTGDGLIADLAAEKMRAASKSMDIN